MVSTEFSQTILVTGGAGYVGSHACKALSAAGYVPLVYDSLARGHPEAVRWGELVVGDLQDTERLTQILRQHAATAVMHFAALAEVGDAVKDPERYYRNNVAGTISLLSAMREAGVMQLVFSSTCAVYGIPARIPIDEDTLLGPLNSYGETKLAIERALRWYGEAYGLRSISLRYFNAAGASIDGEIGENHAPETHLIPLVIRAALDDTYSIRIFGTDYPTPDGTAIRDYIHVSDLADAHLRALEYLGDGKVPVSMALNLGTGRGHSVREIIDAVGRLSGSPVTWREAARRPGDPPALVADSRRAAALLGWTPRCSDIHTIVGSALAWHRRNHTPGSSGSTLVALEPQSACD